jgi:sec-independent protein translocase protein TatA
VITDVLQPWHLIIVLLVVTVVFGPKRLPAIGRDLGRSLRAFRRSVSGQDDTPEDEGG